MRIARQLRDLSALGDPVVLAIGSFDGVHRGHQALIARAGQEAAARRGRLWVMTFDPHPLKVLRPDAAPALLTSTPHKLKILSELGVPDCLVMPFDRTLAAQSPDEFLAALRRHAPAVRAVVVGRNWRFGHRAAGDTDLLMRRASAYDLDPVVLEPVRHADHPISSSRIRQAVAAGAIEEAAAMLGRPFSVLGAVEPGRRLGHTLGYPTANVRPENEVRPPPGIYAVRARLDGPRLEGVSYLATPTADRPEPPVEVHLFDTDADLYRREMEVFFIARLRDDREFLDPSALVLQIAADIEQARLALKQVRPAPA
jgi:riboflavin kinase/FMN adenylyltransferase